MHGLIARKLGMSQMFLRDGEAVPVTYLEVQPNTVVRLKSKERDGYNAVVLGVGARIMRTRKGKELQKFRTQKEWRVDSLEGVEPGKQLTVAIIPMESMVTITGTSKGKGFQGVIKRHKFAGGPWTHGSHQHREPGSIGMRALPGSVHKGKRMPGHMGHETVTIRRRPVLLSDQEKGILGIKGPVPGPSGGIVYITVESGPESQSKS